MRQMADIAAALAAHASSVDELGAARWTAVLQNGTRLAATAAVDDGWLVLEAPAGGELRDLHAAGDRLWTLLEAQGGLVGPARAVLRPGRDAVRLGLRAEIALDDDVDVGLRVREACAALHHASAIVRAKAADAAVDAADPVPATTDLATLVRATGWPVVERSPERLAVELEVPGTFRQALVEARPDGRVCTSLPLAADEEDVPPPAEPVCRAALALLLLQGASVLRLVRAAGDVAAARFEIVLGEAPAEVELRHALAALSTAARLTLREAAVLRADAYIAAAYVKHFPNIVPPAPPAAETTSEGGMRP
jgi:hypothetical protein